MQRLDSLTHTRFDLVERPNWTGRIVFLEGQPRPKLGGVGPSVPQNFGTCTCTQHETGNKLDVRKLLAGRGRPRLVLANIHGGTNADVSIRATRTLDLFVVANLIRFLSNHLIWLPYASWTQELWHTLFS